MTLRCSLRGLLANAFLIPGELLNDLFEELTIFLDLVQRHKRFCLMPEELL